MGSAAVPLRIAPPPRRWAAARTIGREVGLIMLGVALVLLGFVLGLAAAERTAVGPAAGPESPQTVPVLPPARP